MSDDELVELLRGVVDELPRVPAVYRAQLDGELRRIAERVRALVGRRPSGEWEPPVF
jgi:hypothetical protein